MGIHAYVNSFHSYMHEFPFVHRIHKFDHADDLVIMAMTGCWSFMLVYIIMSSWNISHPHLQGQAAETRAVHVEAEEVQGRAGFRGHGVSTGQPSVVGRWIGRSAGSASSATGSSASQDAAKHSCCSNLWNVLTAHWPVGQFGDRYFKILQRQNLKVLEKDPISNLCNNHWIQSDRRCRKKWVNRIGGQGFPILQTEQLLPSPQSNSETEGRRGPRYRLFKEKPKSTLLGKEMKSYQERHIINN